MAEEKMTQFETRVVPRIVEIVHWVRMGHPEREICDRLNVSYSQWNTYKRTYPEFKNTLVEARRQSSTKVEAALFRRATGYEYTEIKTVESEQGTTNTVTTKHVPPDVAAIIYWLNNIEKDFWKSRQEVDQTIKTPQTLADVIQARRDKIRQSNN